jgi:glycosyltransferase involved in cell wall biosynthesis
MKHLFVSREYPPAPYPPGGIGTYVVNIARLLAERGEEVHIIGQRWGGAPLKREVFYDGKLVVHRIGPNDFPRRSGRVELFTRERDGLRKTTYPKQWFGWLAAFRIEELIEDEGIEVVEAQEWEAPLYYFLLRRMLGLGPRRSPPCIVQLHSPTEFICRFNGPTVVPREYPLMKRMETFCIRAADALLCPSYYFGNQAEAHYTLAPGSVKVIHLPKGPKEPIARDQATWANGSICFVGRLEPRKGIIEWIQAATNVARQDRDVHFDFIGADVWRLQDSLVAKLEPALRPRFRFHGSKSPSEVGAFLSRAKAAVVPSRWENFPNVCIEAMGSGLPVIATRSGGMVEMIEDDRTGWLAPDGTGMVDGLAHALRRCLAASPEKLARMGETAADAVTRLCDNERIVDEQIAFRRDVQQVGAQRSRTVAALSHSLGHTARATEFAGGAGIVVSAETPLDAEPLLRSIAAQTTPAAAVALVCGNSVSEHDRGLANKLAGQGVVTLSCASSQRSEAWNAGQAAIRDRVSSGFVLFLDADDLLQPDCLARMKEAFAHQHEIGLVAGWIGREGDIALEAPLSPELSHQLMRNDVGSAVAFRSEALGNAPPFRPLPSSYDLWQLSVAVLAKGWVGVTIPALLAERRGSLGKIPWPDVTALRAIRAELLEAAAPHISPMALDLLSDYAPLPLGDTRGGQSGMAQIMSILKAGARRKISRARTRLLPSRRPTENV